MFEMPKIIRPTQEDLNRALESKRAVKETFTPHQDVTIEQPWNPGSDAGIVDIQTPMYGIGFTGALPPNARLVVVPFESRKLAYELLNDFYTASLPTTGRAWWSSIEGRRIISGAVYPPRDATPQDILVLRPGEVLPFTKCLSSGVSVFTATPWVSLDLQHSPNSLAQDSGHYVVQPRAVVRVYREPQMPSKIPYGVAPARLYWASNSTIEPTQDDETFGFPCGGDVTHVTVHLMDNVSWGNNRARIQAGETANYEIWWLCGGIWAHNPADDFDAAGRGAATPEHDIEVYEVPHNADKIHIRGPISGNTFYPEVIMSTTRVY